MPYRTLEAARQTLGITVLDLWWTYFALGGAGGAHELEEYLKGNSTATDVTHNTIAHALNETFAGRGQDERVPYRGDR